MQVSPSHVIQRSGPSDAKLVSPRSNRSSKTGHGANTASLKLPLLHDVINTSPAITSPHTSGSPVNGQTTARVNISHISQNEALTLLDQYNKIVGDDSRIRQPELPHIKMNMRTDGYRTIPARDRFTTKSLDRVERTGRNVFTEGLSSKSKFKEPPLTMHRRDIIGANMPETVRLARERSNIVFGLNRYRPRKQRHDKISPRSKAFKGVILEPACVTASQITAPLGVPQKVDVGNAWEESNQKHESRIARMLKTMEDRYGRDMIGRTVPSTPSVQSLDFVTSSTAVTTPVMTPRKTPQPLEKPSKPNLSVVSLGNSLADLPQKPRPSVKIPRQNRDNSYNQFERYRQHADDKKLNRFEIQYNSVRERKTGGNYPFIGEMRAFIGNKGKTKPIERIKRQIVVSLKDLTGTQEQDEETEDKDEGKVSKQDGAFHLKGVKGVGTGPRLWSPSSVSTSASVDNPPPSVEVGLFDLEFPHVKDSAAMFTVDEEHTVDETDHLPVEPESHMQVEAKDHTSTGPEEHLPIEPESHLSDANSSHSTHLSVPSLNAGKECRPQITTTWGERPPRKYDPMADLEFAVIDITDAQNPTVSSDMKVTTLELFPGSSDSHVRPTISISGSDEVEADLQKHHKVEVQDEEEDRKDSPEGRSSVQNNTHTGSVHNQSITFISPLETQRNAKRQ